MLLSLSNSSNFIDISNLDLSEIAKDFSWFSLGQIPFLWNKRHYLQLKSKQFYYLLRSFKYEILYNYEGWRISKKRKGPKYMNYEMSKKELQYFTQMLLSEVSVNPGSMSEDSQRILQIFIKQAYPEKFREIFGETKSEVQTRLNIEKFFQKVFA